MPPAQRRHAPGVIDRLLDEPQQFGFFQAVRLLDRWLAEGSPDGQGLSRLHFRNSLSLSFAASEIESLRMHRRPAAPRRAGIDPSDVEQVDITPAFMGLLGVNGTLPLFYTEQLAQREFHQKEHAARAFMDVFSHRAVALFYQAWRKHRLPIQYETDPRDRFLPLVLAIAGLGQKGLRDRLSSGPGQVPDEALAYHAGALQQRALSASQLRQLLSHHLDVPVQVEQFVGRWYRLPESARLLLGVAGTSQGPMAAGALGLGVLGRSAMLGERVWQRDLRLRLVLGPLNHAKFRRFLPGGPGTRALRQLLTTLSGLSLEYEINVCLRREEVRGVTLASSRPPGVGRLGWDTFLQTRPASHDRADVRYDIHAAA